jgi:hypothetical protein
MLQVAFRKVEALALVSSRPRPRLLLQGQGHEVQDQGQGLTGQGQGLKMLSSSVLEAKDWPRGQQDWTKHIFDIKPEHQHNS